MPYTFHSQQLQLIEKATMAVPHDCNVVNMALYNAHISSLRTYTCSPQCREVWKDGQDVGEGEFYFNRDLDAVGTYGDKPVLAYPITKSEDELWKDVFITIEDGKELTYGEIVKDLKQHFAITRK